MTTRAMEERMDVLTKSMGDLAEVVRDMARHVYKQDVAVEEEVDFVPGADPMMEETPFGEEEEAVEPVGMPSFDLPEEEGVDLEVEEDFIPEDEMMLETDMHKAGAKHGPPTMPHGGSRPPTPTPPPRSADSGVHYASMGRGYQQQRRVKGYNDVAVHAGNEEDTPFGEQQDTLEGNQPSPAGRQGGSRTDETFNVKFSAMQRQLNAMQKAMASNGIVVKGITPPAGSGDRGRGGAPMVRDVEVLAKTRSFRELNALREQVGDLPRHMF